ncbi:MAG: NAD(P)/FAD-dependent oxidoreductase [SAR86 cluster bacterium]|uniref:NAD(P)/FAD-dependent oxidoreductase n=1 Tax=SAR86 cluster bacterium TaxID=2030880 RepID=A0A520MS97_9GAMM|nr:MAG: NAD(P)/FAD-dependent oxidoreductase [SAR86 cluster bacterium]
MNISKQTLERALDSASFPVVAALLVHFTGDISILDKLPKPNQAILGETQGFLADKDKQTIKEIALKEINRFFSNSKADDIYIPSYTELNKMMNFIVGEEVSTDYIPMMLSDLNIATHPSKPKFIKATSNLEVLIIGAGMSGILAAIKLAEIGVQYKIYEKNNDLGGTWYENQYPGSRVDIANHFYSYSFEENHHWSEHFSRQPELLDYFKNCFHKYDIHKHTYFETQVTDMKFDELTQEWSVDSICHGRENKERIGIVISCVGQLNQPKIPQIRGLEHFQGDMFHSSQWPHFDAISGKKVAVVGSGASAFQIVPSIAKSSKELTIFQRSPPWMFPNPQYHEEVDDRKKWLLENLPFYSRWYRFLLFYPGSDQLLDSLFIDPNWKARSDSINEANDAMRELFTSAMLEQISDQSLVEKVIPDYPPFGKRMLQDNGAWLEALHLPNVTLLSKEVECMSSKGVVSSGKELEFDTIIFATGFKAQNFFYPINIDGGSGSFEKIYRDSPSSYLGITFSSLPNFFAMYGPGTNLAHAGSIIFNSECQINYICSAIEYMLSNNLKVIRVKPEIEKQYQDKFDVRHEKMVWQHPKVSSWYQNSKGKVVTTSPWRLVEYWNWTNNFNQDDYEF